MIAWRISRQKYADLSGEGAKRWGGRWNARGIAALYLAEHPALALLELLVHLDIEPDYIPNDYVLLSVRVPDNLDTQGIDSSDFPSNTIAFGSKWLVSQTNPVLWVPSFVAPQSYNLVVNPLHADAAMITIKDIEPVTFDTRLF